MNRPAQYHISDPVLPWVYSAKEADAYFDHIEAEREKLIGALEDNEHFKNAVEKFCEEKQGQQNMSDKLEGFSTGWIAARAVLAEVIGEKKELPKFKDIIGLFVEEQHKEGEK